MKLYIITYCFIITALHSCNYLNEAPKSLYEDSTFFKNEEELQAGVNGIYNGISKVFAFNSNAPFFIYLLGNDELCYYYTSGNSTNIRSYIDNFTFTPSDMTIQELWARYYSVIERCNVVIDAATRSNDISLKAQNRAVGEAKFVRAYSYFQLVQFFGDLPLIDKRTITVDYSVSRSPIKEIYKLIVEDLTFAASDNILPIEIVDGSATHWAAKSLLAKVYLTMASCKETARIDGYSKIENSSEQLYQQANIILKDIINNSGRELLPRYEDVFKIENKNKNKESIWEVQYSSIEPYGNQWTKEMGANASGGYSGANGGWRTNTLAGNCALRPLPSLRGYYKERDNSLKYDKRRVWNLIDSTVVFDKTTGVPLRLDYIANLSSANAVDNSNQTVISQGAASKYRWGNDWRESTPFLYSNCPNNVIILRYADILLMFAETEIKLNGNRPTQLAVESINRLIERARGVDKNGAVIPASETPGFINYTVATLTFEQLIKERSRELCFEFWRRHDLIRTGLYEEFVYEQRKNAFRNITSYFDTKKHYLLPIPQYEIDNSSNKSGMYQNPNY